MGHDAGDANMSIIGGDGTTTFKVDLGSNFPVTINLVDVYSLRLYCLPNASSISYTVIRANTGHTASGTLATNIPLNTHFLTPHFYRANGAAAAGVNLDVMKMDIRLPF
jgi:hypothetical protein